MEIKTHNNPIEVNFKCSACKTGLMLFTGQIFITDERYFEHKCNNCTIIVSLQKMYPYIENE